MEDSTDSLDNSSSSPGLLDYFNSAIKTGTSVYQMVDPNKMPTANKQAAAATPSTLSKYLPWIGGGLALALILALVFKRK